MKELLAKVTAKLIALASEHRADTDEHRELMRLVTELLPLGDTAELRDEAWEAMKAHAPNAAALSAFIAAHYDWRLTDGIDELTEASDDTQDALNAICQKVAEAEQ